MEETVHEQQLYDHYKKTEAENFHLKRQLSNKNKEIKKLKHVIRVYKSKLEQKPKKPNYRNYRRGS
jgi:septal ring factor EnvC (AmiA/AmiB activator)